MPHYFFDEIDNGRVVRDEIGYDLPDIDAAKEAAIDALPDMARDQLPDGDEHLFAVRVRDTAGRELLEVSLTLAVKMR